MSEYKERFFSEAKKRLPSYLIAIFILWPLLSMIVATGLALSLPYFQVTLGQALLLSLGGMTVMIPDMIGVGAICLAVAISLFSLLGASGFLRQYPWRAAAILEPVALFFAVLLGTALFYPAVLAHPIFSSFRSFPVWVLTLLLAGYAVGWCFYVASPRHRLAVVAAIVSLGILLPLAGVLRNRIAVASGTPPLVLLGVDSLSHDDNLAHLREWTRASGGA